MTNTLDDDLQKVVKNYRHLSWLALAVLGILVLFGVIILGILAYTQKKQINNQEKQIAIAQEQLEAQQMELSVEQKRLATSCAFFRDVAGAPVVPTPPSTRPSLLGVSIVLDARAAAIGRGCPDIPPPSKELIHWAHYYHLPVP